MNRQTPIVNSGINATTTAAVSPSVNTADPTATMMSTPAAAVCWYELERIPSAFGTVSSDQLIVEAIAGGNELSMLNQPTNPRKLRHVPAACCAPNRTTMSGARATARAPETSVLAALRSDLVIDGMIIGPAACRGV